jgi:hypothetical protein
VRGVDGRACVFDLLFVSWRKVVGLCFARAFFWVWRLFEIS